MNKKTFKHLAKEKERRTKELAQTLLEDESLKNARQNILWIRFHDQLINSFESSNSSRLFWPVLIGALCLLIIGVAWSQRRQSIPLSFELVSPNVSLKLNKAWTLTDKFVIDRLYINNLDTIDAPQLDDIKFPKDTAEEDETARLELRGKKIWLRELKMKQAVSLDLTTKKNRLTFEVKGKPLTGRVDIKTADIELTNSNEIRKTLNLAEKETIEFTSMETFAEPVKVELSLSEMNWKIRDFRTDVLKFLEEYPPGSGKFESTVKSGKIRLLEIGATEELREDDVLLLQGVVTRRLELSKSEQGIKVFFEGEVSAISAGPADYEKNLAPTYLEYLYHQKKIAFFWSTGVFLWGLLWSVKKTIFGK